jgi:hypothetical protein
MASALLNLQGTSRLSFALYIDMKSVDSFTIGKGSSDHITVTVLRRDDQTSSDFWDANWLASQIAVKVGRFSAGFEAPLRTTDFENFRKGLERLSKTLRGDASFETLERWINLRITGDGHGHLRVNGKVTDDPSFGNRLSFSINSLDQTFLPELIESLKRIENSYPSLGSAL